MRKVTPAEEPKDFDVSVRQPGRSYLEKHPGKAPKDFWNKCKSDLYKAYEGYCAYTTFRIIPRDSAVVEHFLPKSLRQNLDECYEWRNYRLASFHVNSVKGAATDLFDPFLLPQHAFVLDDAMFLHVNRAAFATEHDAEKAEYTLLRLGLNSNDLLEDRREAFSEFLCLGVDSEDPRHICFPEHPSNCKDCIHALQRHSLFLYEEAVRFGYCLPIDDTEPES